MGWKTVVKKKHKRIEAKISLFRGLIKKVNETLFSNSYSVNEKVDLIRCNLQLISKLLSACPEISYALSNNYGREIEKIVDMAIDDLTAPQNITSLLLCVREMFFLLDTNIVGGVDEFVTLPYEFFVDPRTDIYRFCYCYKDLVSWEKRHNNCSLGIISVFEHYSISELARQIRTL